MKYYVFIPLLLVLALSLATCKDQLITEEVEIQGNKEKITFSIVKVPYRSPYGPKVVEDIFAGSINNYQRGSKKVPSPSSFGCTMSWANAQKDPKYWYSTSYLYASENMIEAARNTYKQVTVRALSPEAPDGKTMGISRCLVPSSPNIEYIMEEHFKAYAKRSQPDMVIDFRVSSVVIDSSLYK